MSHCGLIRRLIVGSFHCLGTQSQQWVLYQLRETCHTKHHIAARPSHSNVKSPDFGVDVLTTLLLVKNHRGCIIMRIIVKNISGLQTLDDICFWFRT